MASWQRSILAIGMRILAYVLLLLAASCAISFVRELIHSMGHSGVRLSWFGLGLGDRGLVLLWLGLALVSWFVLDECLLRKTCTDGGVRAWRSTLKAYLFVAALTLVGIVLFWTLDGLRSIPVLGWEDPFVGGTVIASGGLLAAIAVSAYGLAGGRGAKAVALVAAFAVMAVQYSYMAGLNNLGDLGFDPWKSTPLFGLKWFTGTVFCFVAAAVCLFAWLERRVFDGTWRAAALAFSCLWAWVFIQNYGIIMPFHHMCYTISAERDRAQELVGWLVAAVWLAAVIVRLYLHRRWKQTRSHANQPAPVGPAQS